MLNLESIASAVALAREYLEDMARNDKGPIRFHVRGCQEGGELFDRQLSTDCLYTPPWGWPVLDSHASTAALSEVLESFYSPGMKTAILTAESPRRQMDVVCDFMDPHLEAPSRSVDDVDVQVQGLTEAVAEICAEELAPGECVAVVCPDMAAFSKKYDLSGHMMFAQDGSETILWTGSCARNGRDPQDVLAAAQREYAYTHRRAWRWLSPEKSLTSAMDGSVSGTRTGLPSLILVEKWYQPPHLRRLILHCGRFVSID